jgi:hypothetical protein
MRGNMNVNASNVKPGQILRVKFYNRETRGWDWENVTVVRPDYPDAMGPSFTGIPMSGRHTCTVLALQYSHVRENQEI